MAGRRIYGDYLPPEDRERPLTDEPSAIPEPPLPGTGAVWVTPDGSGWSASWVEPGPPARDATQTGSWETAHRWAAAQPALAWWVFSETAQQFVPLPEVPAAPPE